MVMGSAINLEIPTIENTNTVDANQVSGKSERDFALEEQAQKVAARNERAKNENVARIEELTSAYPNAFKDSGTTSDGERWAVARGGPRDMEAVAITSAGAFRIEKKTTAFDDVVTFSPDQMEAMIHNFTSDQFKLKKSVNGWVSLTLEEAGVDTSKMSTQRVEALKNTGVRILPIKTENVDGGVCMDIIKRSESYAR